MHRWCVNTCIVTCTDGVTCTDSVLLLILPPCLLSRPGFLMYSMAANSEYEVKSNNYYRGLVDKSYEVGKGSVKSRMETDDPDCVSLQMDCWTAVHTGYMGGICSYINGDWRRESVVLACAPYDKRHSAANVSEWVLSLVEEWKITSKLNVITTDSAANMLGMFNVSGFPSTYISGQCANHLLQRVINTEIFSIERIQNLIEAVRSVVKFANQSNNFCTDLENMQKEENPEGRTLLLVQDVQTRWNSTYMMLERFLKL